MEKRLQCVICIEADENLSALTDICSEVIGGENNNFVHENGEVVGAEATAPAQPLILVLVPLPDEQIVAQH